MKWSIMNEKTNQNISHNWFSNLGTLFNLEMRFFQEDGEAEYLHPQSKAKTNNILSIKPRKIMVPTCHVKIKTFYSSKLRSY